MALTNFHRNLFDRLFDDDLFSRHFDNRLSRVGYESLRLDMKETKNEYIVSVDLPGIDDKSSIDVSVDDDNNLLTIKADRKEERTENQENHYYSERSFGSLSRSISIPKNTDTSNIAAEYTNNGVLNVVIPKSLKTQPRRSLTIK